VDGGMTANPTFVQALADACARVVQVAPGGEATTLGGAFLAGLAVGLWPDLAAVAARYRPGREVAPRGALDRARWRRAMARAREGGGGP
jgi:glycerol kinase